MTNDPHNPVFRQFKAAQEQAAKLAAEIAELKAKVERKSDAALGYAQENTALRAELEAARKERDEALNKLWEEKQRASVAESAAYDRGRSHELTEGNWLEVEKQRDTALAAKDATEKRVAYVIDAIKRWDDDRLKRVEEAEAEAAKWKAENDMYGWNYHQGIASGLNTADILMPKGLSDLLRAALTPAPTQEPPAGGVTISNPSEGEMITAHTLQFGASNNPADVPSEGRGEWMGKAPRTDRESM